MRSLNRDLPAAQQQRGIRASLFRRAQVLVRGWAVTVHIVAFHSRLLELTSLLVLQEPECVRTRDENGDHVFRFTGGKESNFAVEQTAGSPSLAAAAHRER